MCPDVSGFVRINIKQILKLEVFGGFNSFQPPQRICGCQIIVPPPQYVVVWNENVLYFYLLLYFPKDFNKVVFRNPGNRNHPLVVWKNPEPEKTFVFISHPIGYKLFMNFE